jgi:RTX calcium-binding nonapeptide repeat (4 copies)
MRTARRAACALWLAALIACPAAASAATVAVETHCEKYGCGELLVYAAAPGERNDVTAVQENGVVTIRDVAGIEPGTACEALDATGARCTFALQSFQRSANFRLGDRDDSLDAGALETSGLLSGGKGGDLLLGPGAVAISFAGGPGDDNMTGGAAPDIFRTNRRDGSDTMSGGGPPPILDADLFPRRDEVFYARSRSVRAVLDGRANDGERGEHDNLMSIEGVWAGAGDDVVIGTGAAEFMFGGAGRDLLRGRRGADQLLGGDRSSRRRDIGIGTADRLEGGGGPDVLDALGGPDLLIGGSGRDTLDGGRGRDRIRSGDSERDWVLCGRGFDRLAANAGDVVMRGCEETEGALGPGEGIVQWATNSLVVACPVGAAEACRGTLTVSGPALPEVTAPYSAPRGRAAHVPLPIVFNDFDDANRRLSGAVASTANDSARFGELPDSPTDGFLDVLGIPRL